MHLIPSQIEPSLYSDDCADAAVINLLKLRGLTPPSRDQLNGFIDTLSNINPASPGLTPVNILHILGILCPDVCGLMTVPHRAWRDPKPVMTRFLDEGCHLVVFFRWRDALDGAEFGHVVVAEGYDERGMIVLDGALDDGRATIELEPEPLSDDEADALLQRFHADPCGVRRVLPFFPCAEPAIGTLGITSVFIAVYPT
jgi:hypothetical protein